jgi:hypothetical protein
MLGELLRILEKLDDLGNLLLRLVAARDIGKRDLVAVTRQQLRPALAEAQAPRPACRSCRTNRKYKRPMMITNGITWAAMSRQQRLRRLLAKSFDFCSRSCSRLGDAPGRAKVTPRTGLASCRLCPTMIDASHARRSNPTESPPPCPARD